MRKKAQAKRKQAQENTDGSAQIKKMMSGNYQFTDLEIMTLWNSFRIDFPEGQLNAPQLNDVVRRVFPKYKSNKVDERFLNVKMKHF